MTSGYALPVGGRSHGHAYSHSYSGVHLSPSQPITNGFAHSNGSPGKLSASNSPLFTHAESSRETSPVSFTNGNHTHPKHPHSFELNGSAFQENSQVVRHKHNHSEPHMKSRPRGESDHEKSMQPAPIAYQPSLESIRAASTTWFLLPEALTSMLVTLPCILASTTYSAMSSQSVSHFPPLIRYAPLLPLSDSLEGDNRTTEMRPRHDLLNTAILTSGTLLVVGIILKMQPSARARDKDKEVSRPLVDLKATLRPSSLRTVASCTLNVGLPFYASGLLGGSRAGLVLLLAISSNLICPGNASGSLVQQWKELWASKVGTSVAILLCFIVDELGLTVGAPVADLVLGYLALAASILVLPPPYPATTSNVQATQPFQRTVPGPTSDPWLLRTNSTNIVAVVSKTSSPIDADIAVFGGGVLALLTVLTSTVLSSSPTISTSSLILITLTMASMACATLFCDPSLLRSHSKAGLALGCLVTASSSFLFSPSLWPGTVCNGALSALSFLAVLYDTDWKHLENLDHDRVQHSHTHAHPGTHHHHHHEKEGHSSTFTRFLLSKFEPGSLVFSILNEKDSRRITYFATLNFGFMLVQGVYGYLSGSLGLLSDTVHMFLDCLGLVVGLGAAIASKWPTSPERPYGWGKLNTLSGFGNGVFLMLVSVEFVWEAIEGILEKTELRHVHELLVVSVLGLLVNMVGLVFFHSHAGHDHGHSGHSHGHSHSNSSIHSQNGSLNGHSHKHSHDQSHHHSYSHDHGHHHHGSESNDNLHGIFLHIAADAGGSIAVILSTLLNIWRPSFLWDPLATIIIAILIFAAAVPLVVSSGQRLLLVNSTEIEYTIKNALQELTDLRGVVGYSVPRFWIDDKDEAGEIHGHDSHGACDHAGRKKVVGVVHVIAEPSANVEDVRERVETCIAERNMDLVIQVERDGEGQCWCRHNASHSE